MATSAEQLKLQDAADAIVAARDCCGDEREAALIALQDAGLMPTAERLAEAFRRADVYWREQQDAAGVEVPVDSAERRRIESLFRNDGRDEQ